MLLHCVLEGAAKNYQRVLLKGTAFLLMSTLFNFWPLVLINNFPSAILVWGLWTAKSSLLYPHGGTKSLARDYALLLFSKNLNVHSSDVNVRVELDTPVRNCLNIFVLERSDLTGNSELPDESFKILYPNIFGSILLVNFIWFSRHIGFTRLWWLISRRFTRHIVVQKTSILWRFPIFK